MSLDSNDAEEISKMLQFIPKVGEIFDVKEKVGEGTFSKVFRAEVKSDKGKKREYALKYLIPISRPSRIANELHCLKDAGGSNNIVGIEFCLMNKGHVVIVMPYYPHQKFMDYVRLLKVDDIRAYMKNLFIALNAIHSHGIIHRDIKPNNFLYNHSTKTYMLVDFGLAQRVDASTQVHELRQPLCDVSLCLNQSSSSLPQDLSANKMEKLPVRSTSNFSKKRYIEEIKNPPPKKRKTNPPTANTTKPIQVNISSQFIAPSNFIPQNSFSKLRKCDSNRLSSDAKTVKRNECSCFKKPTVCAICLERETEAAPRGGTPGFRAPEVLLKHRFQTTAIDMWSAGVILISILSKKYPFFRAEDDITSLAEMIFLVGAEEMKAAASILDKALTVNLPQDIVGISLLRSEVTPAVYLKYLSTMIQQEQYCSQHTNDKIPKTHCNKCYEMAQEIPKSAFDLVNQLLDPNPYTRITAEAALLHPFIIGCDNVSKFTKSNTLL